MFSPEERQHAVVVSENHNRNEKDSSNTMSRQTPYC